MPDMTPGKRHWTLGVLTLVVALNYVDRFALSILIEPIKRDLALSDTQIGLLTGAAFVLLYSTMAVPIARLAERYNRILVLGVSLVVWSLATLLCGFANSFLLLLVARMMVGCGEAGALAPSHSMVSDLYPERWRGRAMSILALGGAAGSAMAAMFGGWLEQRYGWQVAFMVLGLSGLPLALLLFGTVREPRRGATEPDGVVIASLPFRQALRRLFRRRSFAFLTAAMAMMALGQYSMLLWVPSLFQRNFGLPTAELGQWLALYQGVPYFLGTLAGGFITDRLQRRDERWVVWFPMLAAVAAAVSVWAMFGSSSLQTAFLLLSIPSLVSGLYIAPTYATVQNLSAVHSRATATAVLAFAVSIVGAGIGPLMIGGISDGLALLYKEQSLRYAFLVLIPIYLIGAGLFGLMSRSVIRDLEDARRDSRGLLDTQGATNA